MTLGDSCHADRLLRSALRQFRAIKPGPRHAARMWQTLAMATHLDLCKRFFEGTASGDRKLLEAVCADDFTGTQNGGPAMDLNGLVLFSQAAAKAVDNFRYENPVRTNTDTGFVEEHDVCCTLPDGSEMRARLCVVGEVTDGKIISVREYADSRAAAGLLKALTG